jgi:hypothetical protein
VNQGLRLVLSLVCVTGSVAAIYNVVAENGDVEKMAEGTACGQGEGQGQRKDCRPQMTRTERTPWSQTFEFATSQGTVTVRCARGAILVGDYACVR